MKRLRWFAIGLTLALCAGVVAQDSVIPSRLRLQSLGVGVAAPAGIGNVALSGSFNASSLTASTSFNGNLLNLDNGAVDGFLQADGTGISLGTTSNHPLSFYVNNTVRGRFLTTGVLDSIAGFSANGVGIPTLSAANVFSQSGTNTQTIETTGSTGAAQLVLRRNGGGAAQFCVTGSAAQCVSGAANGDLGINVNGAAMQFSVTNGTTAAMTISSAGAVALPASTTIGATSVCLSNGTNCPQKTAFGMLDTVGACGINGSYASSGITSCTRTGLGLATVDVTAAGFSTIPVCTISIRTGGNGGGVVNGTSATSVSVGTFDMAGTNADFDWQLVCVGT